jgi:hypothetical protein
MLAAASDIGPGCEHARKGLRYLPRARHRTRPYDALQKGFWKLSLAIFLAGAVVSSGAVAADVYRDTPFFARENGRMVPVDPIPADVEILPLKATPDGRWLRVWWKEREGWIGTRDVRGVDVSKLRAPAAVADARRERFEDLTPR